MLEFMDNLLIAVIQDRHWLENDFLQLSKKEEQPLFNARGKSSAASAAQAIIDAIRDTLSSNTSTEHWFSSAIDSEGNPYGIEENLIFSFPCPNQKMEKLQLFQALDIHEFLETKLKASERELLEERDLVRSLIS